MARTIPVLLGFLARLIGLGDVSGAIKKVITAIQEKVDKAIDAVIAWVVDKAKSLFGGKDAKSDPKWDAAVAGVGADVDAMAEPERTEDGFKKRLPTWKTTYGFKELLVKHEAGELVIEGSMSPGKKVKAVKDPQTIFKEIEKEEELQMKTSKGGWRTVRKVNAVLATNTAEWELLPPQSGKGTFKFADYGRLWRRYIPGTGFLKPARLATENANKLGPWGDRNVARLVLNFRANEDDSQFNPPEMEWHHIHEHSGGGENSVANLVLTSKNNNRVFKNWFERPQIQRGALERTYPLQLRDYLKEKNNSGLWKAWGDACLIAHGVAVQDGSPDPKGAWKRIPAEAKAPSD